MKKKNKTMLRVKSWLSLCLLPVVLFSACSPSVASSSAAGGSLPTVVMSQPVPSAPIAPSVPSTPPASSQLPQSQPAPTPPTFAFTEEELARLNTLLDEWAAVKEEEEQGGHNVAVYFQDLDSGLTYTYNSEKVFAVASLNKAPYSMYLYHLVETGAASLTEKFWVTTAMLESSQENSGKLKEMEDLPKEFTLEELLYYLLHYSDTAAFKILLARYGAAGYKTYLQEIEVPTEHVRNVINGRITAPEAGAYLNALYNFMQSSQYGPALHTELSNTRYKMIRSAHPYAGKYGWDEGAYHDMAIIYAPHPYALAVLTGKDEGTAATNKVFATIAAVFEEIMEQKWAVVEG
ncbi:class A beta-lactamase-related serine hydrolase [Ruminococcaceae bacterium OttesenSCG-928-A16]|nr:class A beta-lactamase-related serine hydrolase [Ruminococcaceae bacterium OttesenSCG-928-A16]